MAGVSGRLGLIVAIVSLVAYLLLGTYYFLVIKEKITSKEVEDFTEEEQRALKNLINNV